MDSMKVLTFEVNFAIITAIAFTIAFVVKLATIAISFIVMQPSLIAFIIEFATATTTAATVAIAFIVIIITTIVIITLIKNAINLGDY